eukprot:5470728-Amphidinium_carterae.1
MRCHGTVNNLPLNASRSTLLVQSQRLLHHSYGEEQVEICLALLGEEDAPTATKVGMEATKAPSFEPLVCKDMNWQSERHGTSSHMLDSVRSAMFCMPPHKQSSCCAACFPPAPKARWISPWEGTVVHASARRTNSNTSSFSNRPAWWQSLLRSQPGATSSNCKSSKKELGSPSMLADASHGPLAYCSRTALPVAAEG